MQTAPRGDHLAILLTYIIENQFWCVFLVVLKTGFTVVRKIFINKSIVYF